MMRQSFRRRNDHAPCRCGHLAMKHFGPTRLGPCSTNCGCTGYRDA